MMSGATPLALPIGEGRPLFRDAIDVGRLVAHHALAVVADVPIADFVAPMMRMLGLSGFATISPDSRWCSAQA
jgi:hypothetical protein